jgi:hypothetical protein
MNYRKLWESINGPIPRDESGFSYEIHHLDGNRNNNSIDNLICVPIKEHLQIHLDQEDWGAASLIARRLGLGAAYMSEIQTGKKRPGIGGAPKGRDPWNKNKPGCFSEETINKFKSTRKGKRWSSVKITDEECKEILNIYISNPNIESANKKSKNGKTISYETAFSKLYCEKYNVTSNQIYNIITGKRNVL